MKCPVCDGKVKVIDKREPKEIRFTTHRHYECLECLTRFKSSEKILFTSLPKYIRDKYLDSGETR